MPREGEVRVACVSILLVCILYAGLSLAYGYRGLPFQGRELGGDFAAWYVAGKIMNEHPGKNPYDLKLQYRLQHELRPKWDADTMLVYANTPFLALLFQPLARLPYFWAYVLWLAISASLYVAGFLLVWPRDHQFRALRPTALLMALSFFPFAFECWFGGHLSTIGFLAMALSIRCRQLGRPFLSGLALALCGYKPTLLVFALPVLAMSGAYRALLGFTAGAGALGALSLAAVGYEGCLAYLRTLKLYAEITGGNEGMQRVAKYVDLNASLRLLTGEHTWASSLLFMLLAGAAFTVLCVLCVRSRGRDTGAHDLLWAVTLVWTLVFNRYTPIYDTILLVLSAVLVAGVLYRSAPGPLHEERLRRFHGLLLVVCATACVTQLAAPLLRVQPLMIVLAAAGAMWIRIWHGNTRRGCCG